MSDDKSIEYKLGGNKLTVSKGGKSLMIDNFKNYKKDPHLLAAMKHSKNIQRAAAKAKSRIQR